MVDIEHEKAIIGITSFLKYTIICTTQLHKYPEKRVAAQNFSVCPFPMFAFKIGKYLLGKFLLHLFYDFTEQFNTTSDIDVYARE